MQAIQDLQRRNRSAMIYDLKRSTKFTNTELMTLYEEYKNAIAIDSRNHCLQPDQFDGLFKHHVPWWPIPLSDKKEWRKLFVMFDISNERVLSFSRYVRGLDIVLRGLLNAHQKLGFDLYSVGNKLPKENFDQALRLVLSMHRHVNTDVLNKIKAEEFEIIGEPDIKKDQFDISARRLNEIWLHIKEEEHIESVNLRTSQKDITLETPDPPKDNNEDKPAQETEQTVSEPKEVAKKSNEVPFGLEFMFMTLEQFQISCSLILAEAQTDSPTPKPLKSDSDASLTESTEFSDFTEL